MINRRKQIHCDHASVRSIGLPRFLQSLVRRASPIQSKHPHQSEFDEARVGLPELCLVLPIHKDAPMKHSILQTPALLESIACSHFLPKKSHRATCSFQRACHAANRTISYVFSSSVRAFVLKTRGMKQLAPKGTRITIGNQDRPVVKSFTVCISQQPCFT